MQLNQLQPTHKRKNKKRVGRGGVHGTYSGRGIKGQSSRAGRKMQPAIRSLIKRYPKLRGYRFKPQESNLAVVNIGILEKKFQSGEKISPAVLLDKKIIRRIKGVVPRVKILGTGKLTKALTVKNCLVSKKAKEAIEKANGQIL